jgi:hypothetical protein
MKHIAALLAVVWAVFVPMSAFAQIGGFSPSLFQFVTQIPDTGEGVAGGWQTAFAALNFEGIRPGLVCTVRVQMPIRNAAHGRISRRYAADVSAEVATAASRLTWRTQPEWVGEDFCIAWRASMNVLFLTAHEGLGARATKN